MKKIVKIFAVLSIGLLTILFVLFWDQKQDNAYVNLPGYDSMVIELPNDITVSERQLDEMEKLSDKYDVIIMGQHYDEQNTCLQNFINIDQSRLVNILHTGYKNLHKINNDSMELATFNTGKQTQTGRLYDFLDNKRLEYLSFSQIMNKGVYKNMMYIVYYQSGQKVSTYLNSLQKIFHIKQDKLIPDNAGIDAGYKELISYIIIIVIIVVMVFYFILQIFMIYNMSHELGALRLLGIEKNKILFIIEKNNIKIHMITTIVIFLLCVAFLKNITISFMLSLLSFDLILLILLYVVSYLSLTMILNMNSLNDLLKYKKLTNRLTKISIGMKVVFSIAIFLITGCFCEIGTQYYARVQDRIKNKNILDYGVFYSTGTDDKEANNVSLLNKLYKEVCQSDIEFYYSDFIQYCVDQEDAYYQQCLDNKTEYQFGIVDHNFIDKQDLKLFDEKGHKYIIKDNTDIFLIPLSKKNEVKNFEKVYKEDYGEIYKEKKKKVLFSFVYYEDKKIKTFKPYLSEVQSPIMHVISKDYPFTQNDGIIGVYVAGTQFNTALTIKNSEQSKAELFSIIDKLGLKNVLKERNFYSYSDYYRDNLKEIKNEMMILLSLFVVVFLIYLLISYEFVTLSIEDGKDIILVKFLLGIDRKSIFKILLKRNKIMMFIVVIISAIIYYLIKLQVYDYIVALISVFIDYFIIIRFISRLKMNKVAIALKGGDYI